MFIQRIIDSGSTAVHFLSTESIVVVMRRIVWCGTGSDVEGVEGSEEEHLEIPEPEPQNSVI